jgi:hypothetical protein
MIFTAAAPMRKIRLAFIPILSPSGRGSDSYLVCYRPDLSGQQRSAAAALPDGEDLLAECRNAGFV